MIKVQTATGHEGKAEGELRALIKDIRKSSDWPGLHETVLYDHASIPGCFVMQLTWDSEMSDSQGSLLGLRLVQTAKSFGLADHSVWIQIE